MQLVAYGAQDVYLTGNPLITFFKVIYRRHTNFAVESIEQTFNGSTSFKGSEKKVTATISRNGDLITNAYLEITLPDPAGSGDYYNNVGHNLIKSVELEIGGQRIDKWYSEMLNAWMELTLPEEKKAGYKTMTGCEPSATAVTSKGGTLYIPLQFFFCRNVGLALPLIALQYHEVKFHVEFRSYSDLTATPHTTDDPTVKLYVDYVYLDTDERRRFAQVSHEMLIEQVQFTGEEAVTAAKYNNVKLNFNHPVKELIIMADNGDNASSRLTYLALDKMKLMLNGHERFSERDATYFKLVQPYQHHTRIPSNNIYVYSFALKPEEHQPSGTCNFSRIDNATLSIKTKASTTRVLVYAMSYNVLRIMSGMGGLAFSN